jgi:hypothetical protein
VDRLEKFRQINARLDPARPVRGESAEREYVALPHGCADRIASSLLLNPHELHLLVGSIGCGKSTEAIAIERELGRDPGFLACYYDVGQFADTADLHPEVIATAMLTAAAAKLVNLSGGASPARELFREIFVHGQQERVDTGAWDSDWDGVREGTPVKLPRRSSRAIPHILQQEFELLGKLQKLATSTVQRSFLVWIIDGLDRLPDADSFDRLVSPLVPLLKSTRTGAVVIGPRRSIEGLNRLEVAAEFEPRVHHVFPLDPASRDADRESLRTVLLQRQYGSVASDAVIDSVVQASGGVLRLLIHLAKESLREAWTRKSDAVELRDVEAAAQHVGRVLLYALTDDQIDVLAGLLATGTFAPRSSEEQSMVLTNQVLSSSDGRYRVHPALVPFLKALRRI